MSGAGRSVPGLGDVVLRPVDPRADGELLHAWLTAPRARFWLLQGADREQVEEAYAQIDRSAHHEAVLGLVDGRPEFLAERYEPAHDPVGEVYEVQPGDRGMHLFLAPAEEPRSGFSTAVMRAVLDWVFDDPAVQRVVVEPDVENTAVHELNARVGFRTERVVDLGDKHALLSTVTREQYTATLPSRSSR